MKPYRDIVILMALEMDAPSILNLCRTNKDMNRYVCENPIFWERKFKKDYPDKNYIDYGNNYKEAYKNISKLVEIEIATRIDFMSSDDNENEDTEKEATESEDTEKEPTEKNIFLSGSIVLEGLSKKEMKTQIYNAITDFFQQLWVFGYYDITIDGNNITQIAKFIRPEYFDDVDYNTQEIYIILDTMEIVHESDEDAYQNLLSDVLNDYNVEE